MEIISSEDLVNTKVELIDLAGKLISSRPINIMDGKTLAFFNVDLAKGTYIVRIVSADQIHPVKVVIQ